MNEKSKTIYRFTKMMTSGYKSWRCQIAAFRVSSCASLSSDAVIPFLLTLPDPIRTLSLIKCSEPSCVKLMPDDLLPNTPDAVRCKTFKSYLKRLVLIFQLHYEHVTASQVKAWRRQVQFLTHFPRLCCFLHFWAQKCPKCFIFQKSRPKYLK